MSFTDDELREFTERPSLRERAKQAALAKQQLKHDAQSEEYAGLCERASWLMTNVLEMTLGEVTDVEFRRGQQNIDRPKVEFSVEGFSFRVRNRTEAIHIDRSGKKECVGHELIPVYEFRPPNSANWREIEQDDIDAGYGMAAIGEVFGVPSQRP